MKIPNFWKGLLEPIQIGGLFKLSQKADISLRGRVLLQYKTSPSVKQMAATKEPRSVAVRDMLAFLYSHLLQVS